MTFIASILNGKSRSIQVLMQSDALAETFTHAPKQPRTQTCIMNLMDKKYSIC